MGVNTVIELGRFSFVHKIKHWQAAVRIIANQIPKHPLVI